MTLARRFCRNPSDAEELVNRTFAAVVEGIDGFLEQSSFFTWMCQILVNLNANDNRRKANGDIVYPGELPEVADESADDGVYKALDAALLRDAIRTLPEDIRKTVVLHYFMEMSVKDIARFLAIPTGTVMWRLHYARKMLAVKMGVAAKNPGGKAVILALLLCGLTALGAGTRLAVVRLLSSSPVAVEQQADNSKDAGHAIGDPRQAEACIATQSATDCYRPSATENFNFSTAFSGEQNMNITKTKRAAAMLAAATSSFAALAADYTGYLSLSSAGDATWDTSTATWKTDGSDLRAYTNGANVVIGPDFTGTTVTPGAWLQPGNVVFDSASDIVLGASVNNNGFGGNTVSLSKRGSGKLTIKSGYNYNLCPWHVYEGTLATEDASTSALCAFGSYIAEGAEPTIYVHDGAVLEDPSNNTLGSKNDTAEAEDKCVTVVVYTNGVFRPGQSGNPVKQSYPYSTVRDLILDGGTLDASKKGSWGGGVLKVTRKLAFKGTTPYSFASGGQCWKLALSSSRLTEIAVDDITGNGNADVTLGSSSPLRFGRVSEAAVTGFRKTGMGTFVYQAAITDGTKDSACGWLGVNGTIAVDEGTLQLENASSTFTGDIVIRGGTLNAGKSGSVSAPTDLTTTCLGDITADRVIVLDGPSSSLPILCRWPFGKIECYTNEAVSAVFVVTNGATFAFGDTASVRPVTLPNLWLCDGGIAFNDGEYGVGVGMVAGTFKVTGSTPVTVAPAAGKSYQYLVVNPAMGMNAGSTLQTTFDIADVTGDAAADTTFTMPFGAPNFAMASASGQAYLDGVEVGFRKTGDGTLSLAYPRTSFGANGIGEVNGTLAVETGTLDLRVAAPKATVSVSSGAALSGGDVYVKSVRIAAGGGFAAANGATTAVRATESVSFGATGFIDISTTSGTGTDFAPTVAFKIGTATVSGMANLANWTVRVNGRALNPGQASIRLRDDGSIVAKKTEATFLYVR